jgi:hypothetical protein
MVRQWLYAALIGVALLLIRIFPVEHDPGPARGQRYPRWDRWSKWHLFGSALLAAAAVLILHVAVPWAIVLTILAGIGWELDNGYVDPFDILWDSLGALGGGLLAWAILGWVR